MNATVLQRTFPMERGAEFAPCEEANSAVRESTRGRGLTRMPCLPRLAICVGWRLLQCRRLDQLPAVAFVPGPAGVMIAKVSVAGRVIKVLIDKFGCGRNLSYRQRILAHAFKRQHEGFHMRDFAGHQE